MDGFGDFVSTMVGWGAGSHLEVLESEADVPSTNGVHDDELAASSVPVEITDDSLVNARHQLADAVDDLVGVLRSPEVMASLPETDRANLAKYLTINKLKH